MSLTEALLKGFTVAYPRIAKLAQRVQQSHNFMVNYALSLEETPSKGHAIVSSGKIRRGNDIMLISSEQCLFSTGLAGASPSEESQISEQMLQLSQRHDSMNDDYLSRMKIYLQLIANVQGNRSNPLPVRDYAEYILGSEVQGISKADINSRFLFELYQSWQTGNRITFGYLKKELLKRFEEEDFLNACNKGKNIIRSAGETSFKFAVPFVDKLHHSFTPNCEFDLVYFPHRKTPFVRIKTITDIQAGERPTLSYGKLNNYQLLLRYGFTVKDNPFSIFMLHLNFEHILEIFNKNIEWKQRQFLKHGFRLKNYVKILPNGQIDGQDLKMLRIIINDDQNPKDEVVSATHLDQLIHHFVCDHAKGLRKNIKINSLKVSSNVFVRQLQQEQISILESFILRHGK